MKRYHRFPSGFVTLGLGLALLAGCQHSMQRPNSVSPLGSWGEEKTQLTPSQTADVKIAIARSLEKRGDTDQAMATYRAAVDQDPKRADACMRLAVLSDKRGKFAESEKWYQKALAAQPGSPDIFCNMGYSLYLQHRWDEAEMNFRQALAISPDHYRAHNNLGMVLARCGREDEALVEFRRGGCTPSDVEANLAFALTLERNWDKAHQHYEAALAAEPSSPSATKGLHQLEAVMAKAGVTRPPCERVKESVKPAPSNEAASNQFPAVVMVEVESTPDGAPEKVETSSSSPPALDKGEVPPTPPAAPAAADAGGNRPIQQAKMRGLWRPSNTTSP
jgi:Flp pilus assembly protein TadD